MSGKMVRPHMGVKVGEEFVGHVKATMVEHSCSRDFAIKHILWESRYHSQIKGAYRDIHKKYREALTDCGRHKNSARIIAQGSKELRQENRKLYMVIAILSVACVTLALM